ncbi:capsular polysaccharide export protein [Novosphingobium kunmingense]|uniref:Capsular polysaccharide export protein n=1 Tax=Novosphingobium kunmingense TaxID=1211806 RepID=A0A2N0HJA9_9SPHN|nr:capsular biosynthesis protein [Novosphingobium kunmingense]PKB19009.1 capsular polysaccharide export protein [Novosphingobium kunmingense]
MRQRHFLFLQGLPGPAFRRIARRVELRGHATSRVNFNGGDWADWHFAGTNYRGRAQHFADWLAAHARASGVTDIVLLGERRPLHLQAIAAAQRLAIDVHVFEEGYLRPNSVAIERWRGGEPWQAPLSLADCARRAPRRAMIEAGIENRFVHRWREAVAYWTFATMLWPWFPRYRSHRVQSAWHEMTAWIRRYVRGPAERRDSARDLAALGEAPFFLFPLQLDGDAQLVHRSPFASMEVAAGQVLASFAAHAPVGTRLVIKRHPFDPDPRRWRRRLARLAAAHGLTERVHYVEHADLERLIERCQGVVTVNSTVGGLALRRGRPVHAIGRALYAMPGLASAGPPDAFWAAPPPVAAEDYATFAAALWQECLVNAGFHGRDALARLETEAAQRLCEE